MKVSQFLQEKCCFVDLQSTDKETAIRAIAHGLSAAGKVSDEEQFIGEVLERESLGSTGIGHTVAIPHARTEAVKGFVIGFGRSKEGIDFSAIDNQKVNLIFLMGAHPGELNLYLRVLAELSKLLMNGLCRQALIDAPDGKTVIDVVRQFESA